MKILLKADGISKEFESLVAVNNLSFEIEEGEIFSLLGPNGSGKTTTVRMAAGIIKPDTGTIQFDSKYKKESTPRFLGYLPEDRGLYKEIAIIKSLVYLGVIQGLEKQIALKCANQWLEKFGLSDRSNDKFEKLSKGNQQKIQFISSVIHKPSFAILDEPFSGLDPINQELFIETIIELKKTGTTFLLSSHQMNLVERITDRVLLLNKGKSILNGTINEIKNNSSVNKIIRIKIPVGCSLDYFEHHDSLTQFKQTAQDEITFFLKKGTHFADLLRGLPAGLKIDSVNSEQISLHEIYLQKVKEDMIERGNENE